MRPVKQDEELEVAREDLDPDYVRRRIDDWVRRIDDIYSAIRQAAVAAGISVADGPPVVMHEEVMKRYKIGPRQLPTLLITAPGRIIKVIPKGLWTIGGNGRIDLVTSRGLFMLVDFADEPFSRPTWRIYGPGHRDGTAYAPETVLQLVA